MRLLRRIRAALHRCPTDCGVADPAGIYRDVSFANQPTTPDQARIADVLATQLRPESRILHIGVGNSGLAVRFAPAIAHIEGITIVPDELTAAIALNLPNYRVTLLNKHSPSLAKLPGPFDVIVDNNPGSFACCRRHFGDMLHIYANLLSPTGQILTDERGANWRQSGGLALNWRTWSNYGKRYNLVPKRITASVWSLGVANPAPVR